MENKNKHNSTLTSEGPTCRRIVRAFLDFLHSVEPAPGVDVEALEVAKDCLTQVFGIRDLPQDDVPEPNLLLNLFTSRRGQDTPPAQNCAGEGSSGTTPKAQDHAASTQSDDTGVSKDELFGQFFDALEKIHFFRTTSNGDDDHVLLDKATNMFHDAVNEIERSGCNIFDRKSLADALKTLGNKAMQSKLYSDAIELYTCATALCENNAVYYCNRAAAYTQTHKYNEAVKDCLKSIDIDPKYSKAYSRLGLAYYAQGKYSDAIDKGFRKALELDPNNDAVKENIRVAEQKLIQEQERRSRYQDSGNHFAGGSGNQGTPPPFASIPAANLPSIITNLVANLSQNQNEQNREADGHGTQSSFTSGTFDSNAAPPDIASMFMNMAGNAFQGQHSQSMPADQNHESGASNSFSSMSFDAGTVPSDVAGMFMNMAGLVPQAQSSQDQPQGSSNIGSEDPGIGIGANVNFNFNAQTPEELNRTFRSMMGMFSGGGQGDPQNNVDENSGSR